MKLYQIEWEKYLSTERSRPSNNDKSKIDPENHFDERNDFDSDFGRAVFSSACRRMHDKTQVMPLSSDDNVHSRLTHSLEVMSIAQSLGDNICRKSDFTTIYGKYAFEYERKISAILRTAAIMHDIGNPPFGHFGEHVISKYFETFFVKMNIITITEEGEEDKKQNIITLNTENPYNLNEQQVYDFIQYDGNAQGLRVITKLQYLNDLDGLNLTYATLGAYLKYPNERKAEYVDYIGAKKHGVYFSEKEIFEKIVLNCGLKVSEDIGDYIKRHPLSFLVEAADTICYRSMDIEDGWSLEWYSFDEMVTNIDKELKIESGNDINICNVIGYKIDEKRSDPDRKRMVDFRVKLIQYFVNLSNKNFINNLESIDKGTYKFELLDEDNNKVESALKEFNKKYIFTNREIQLSEFTGSSVLKGLLDILIKYYFNDDKGHRNHAKNITSKTILRTAIHEQFKNEPDVKFIVEDMFNLDLKKMDAYAKLRIIVDFVSGMTDQYAVKLYQRLSGQKL